MSCFGRVSKVLVPECASALSLLDVLSQSDNVKLRKMWLQATTEQRTS